MAKASAPCLPHGALFSRKREKGIEQPEVVWRWGPKWFFHVLPHVGQLKQRGVSFNTLQDFKYSK